MKQEEKSQSTRKKILDAAGKVFLEKGYDTATMQDIVAESGFSKGAIYHHFTGKQEILEEMIVQAQRQINSFFEEIAEDISMSAKEKVRRILTYLASNNNQRMLLVNRWVEKAPYALLETVRNNNEFIAPQIAKIVMQGMREEKHECTYNTEIAEVLSLLLDVWLDPVIMQRTSEDILSRLDFIFEFLERMGVSILDEDDKEKTKALYLRYSVEESDMEDEKR